jgi:hypothetical protein
LFCDSKRRQGSQARSAALIISSATFGHSADSQSSKMSYSFGFKYIRSEASLHGVADAVIKALICLENGGFVDRMHSDVY